MLSIVAARLKDVLFRYINSKLSCSSSIGYGVSASIARFQATIQVSLGCRAEPGSTPGIRTHLLLLLWGCLSTPKVSALPQLRAGSISAQEGPQTIYSDCNRCFQLDRPIFLA